MTRGHTSAAGMLSASATADSGPAGWLAAGRGRPAAASASSAASAGSSAPRRRGRRAGCRIGAAAAAVRRARAAAPHALNAAPAPRRPPGSAAAAGSASRASLCLMRPVAPALAAGRGGRCGGGWGGDMCRECGRMELTAGTRPGPLEGRRDGRIGAGVTRRVPPPAPKPNQGLRGGRDAQRSRTGITTSIHYRPTPQTPRTHPQPRHPSGPPAPGPDRPPRLHGEPAARYRRPPRIGGGAAAARRGLAGVAATARPAACAPSARPPPAGLTAQRLPSPRRLGRAHAGRPAKGCARLGQGRARWRRRRDATQQRAAGPSARGRASERPCARNASLLSRPRALARGVPRRASASPTRAPRASGARAPARASPPPFTVAPTPHQRQPPLPPPLGPPPAFRDGGLQRHRGGGGLLRAPRADQEPQARAGGAAPPRPAARPIGGRPAPRRC
jgi:hypothetical protein